MQVPLWVVLLIVPFAWDFVEESKGESYSFLATVLLAAVAHHTVIDDVKAKSMGLSTFDIEYILVLSSIFLTSTCYVVCRSACVQSRSKEAHTKGWARDGVMLQ